LTRGLRQIVFLDAEIKAVEQLIAQQALSWPEIRRLMTVPGVNLICAATFIGAIGRADRGNAQALASARRHPAGCSLHAKPPAATQAPSAAKAQAGASSRECWFARLLVGDRRSRLCIDGEIVPMQAARPAGRVRRRHLRRSSSAANEQRQRSFSTGAQLSPAVLNSAGLHAQSHLVVQVGLVPYRQRRSRTS
jgi:hypothetical protein